MMRQVELIDEFLSEFILDVSFLLTSKRTELVLFTWDMADFKEEQKSPERED